MTFLSVGWLVWVPYWLKGLNGVARRQLANNMLGAFCIWPILCGETLIEEGAKTLNELSGLIDTSRQKEVAFKMIVTATGDYAYQRKDGIFVCPLSALRP